MTKTSTLPLAVSNHEQYPLGLGFETPTMPELTSPRIDTSSPAAAHNSFYAAWHSRLSGFTSPTDSNHPGYNPYRVHTFLSLNQARDNEPGFREQAEKDLAVAQRAGAFPGFTATSERLLTAIDQNIQRGPVLDALFKTLESAPDERIAKLESSLLEQISHLPSYGEMPASEREPRAQKLAESLVAAFTSEHPHRLTVCRSLEEYVGEPENPALQREARAIKLFDQVRGGGIAPQSAKDKLLDLTLRAQDALSRQPQSEARKQRRGLASAGEIMLTVIKETENPHVRSELLDIAASAGIAFKAAALQQEGDAAGQDEHQLHVVPDTVAQTAEPKDQVAILTIQPEDAAAMQQEDAAGSRAGVLARRFATGTVAATLIVGVGATQAAAEEPEDGPRIVYVGGPRPNDAGRFVVADNDQLGTEPSDTQSETATEEASAQPDANEPVVDIAAGITTGEQRGEERGPRIIRIGRGAEPETPPEQNEGSSGEEVIDRSGGTSRSDEAPREALSEDEQPIQSPEEAALEAAQADIDKIVETATEERSTPAEIAAMIEAAWEEKGVQYGAVKDEHDGVLRYIEGHLGQRYSNAEKYDTEDIRLIVAAAIVAAKYPTAVDQDDSLLAAIGSIESMDEQTRSLFEIHRENVEARYIRLMFYSRGKLHEGAEQYNFGQRGSTLVTLAALAEFRTLSEGERAALAPRSPIDSEAPSRGGGHETPSPETTREPEEEARETITQRQAEILAAQMVIDKKTAELAHNPGDQARWIGCFTAYKVFLEQDSEDLSIAQIAGMLGNGWVESVGCNPAQYQYGGGPGRGIFQWGAWEQKYDRFGHGNLSEISDRTLRAFAKRQGWRWDNLHTQVKFTFWEFQNTEVGAYLRLKGADSPEEAAEAFMLGFERPRDKSQGAIKIRQDRARMLFDSLNIELKKIESQYSII